MEPPEPQILVVDDARDIREPLGQYLRKQGFRTQLAANAAEARRIVDETQLALVVLDVMMPGEDGLSLCRWLVARGGPPVILLTAMAEETDRIVGLELGADAYLIKPFNPRELLARIRAVLRRALPPEPKPATGRRRFGGWRTAPRAACARASACRAPGKADNMARLGRIAGASLLLAALLLGCQQLRMSRGPDLLPRPEQGLRIATYNVHYILLNQPDGRWGLSGWQARKEPLDAAFKAMDADIVAFQEMESFAGGDDGGANLARASLLDNNPSHAAAAIGDWRDFPSTQPIFYRRERLELTDQGWFFFSDTPEAIYSRTYDGSYPAFASWAAFRDRRSDAAFRVVNVHLDYASRENRRRSTALIAERIGPWIAAGETVFLAGDLNARLGSNLHRMLEETGLRFVPVQGATYHFDRGLNLFGAIDHLGYAGDADLLRAPSVLRRRAGSVWPTDHYPVVADFDFSGR